MSRRTTKLLSVSAALAVVVGVSGCGADDDVPVGGDAPTTTTTGPQTTTTAAPTQYFADASHLGKEVTITAPVVANLTDESVVVDAGTHGDESLLVLFKGDKKDFAEGKSLTVKGTVQTFSYDDYADKYGLGEAALFDVYADEEFLEAKDIVDESPAPTS